MKVICEVETTLWDSKYDILIACYHTESGEIQVMSEHSKTYIKGDYFGEVGVWKIKQLKVNN